LCIVSPFVYNCHFPIFEQVCRSLPPDGNPMAVNNYHIISLRLLAPDIKKPSYATEDWTSKGSVEYGYET
jgi:hypothetical protein